MFNADEDQIKGFYGLGILAWLVLTISAFPLCIVFSPLVLLVITVGSAILVINMRNVCDDAIYDDGWVKNSVPIYMGFAIITLFLTIYRYSDIPDSKIYRTFISYIVLSMVLFYGPITNVCFVDTKHRGFKMHIDNILIILSIGVLIFLIAVAASFPAKLDKADTDMLDVML